MNPDKTPSDSSTAEGGERTPEITLASIYRARRTIAAFVRRTPLVPSISLSSEARDVRMKLETLQDIGSFKIRGAANRIANLSDAEKQSGVVAVSTGNHGRGVALAASRLGIRATVFMSSLVPEAKIRRIRDLGADVRIGGAGQDEAEVEAEAFVRETGAVMIHPFDDPYVIAGQGTIGLELVEDMPDIDTAIVPLSGGGLIGGIAFALKSVSRDIRVVGVSMERGPAMVLSQRAGRPVPVREEESLADSLGGGIGLANRHTFALVRDHVDEMLLVSEDQIAAAMRHAFREEQMVLEGGAAVGIAAFLSGAVSDPGRHCAIVLSGRNVDPDKFLRVVGGHGP